MVQPLNSQEFLRSAGNWKMFGAQSTPAATPGFGTPATPGFGTPSTPGFGTPAAPPGFGTPASTPAFGTPSAAPAFGTPSTPSFVTGFGTSSLLSPFSQQSQPQQQQTPSLFQTPQFQQQQQTPSLFQTPQPQQSSGNPFGLTTAFNPMTQSQVTATPALWFSNSQLTTQMAPVAPLPFSFVDRDLQGIVDAYKQDSVNPKYSFQHLLFSVTELQQKIKPTGVSDILWAEAMEKLAGMESSHRERLWPQLVQGFKDLSNRLKIQDEVILSDSERLKMTQSNVKMLQRHFQVDTLPCIQRLQHKEQNLQRRLLRIMRIIEALEGKGCRVPLMKAEVELAKLMATVTRQLKGSGAELSRRVQNLLTRSRLQADGRNGSSLHLPGSTKIQEQSLSDMQEVLQQQTVAIARLGNVLKRDIRDMDIIMAEDAEMAEV